MTPVIIGDATLYLGNSLDVLPTIADNSIDAVVCDPPYELGFMGKPWDASGIANNPALWAEVLRVLKPGGHLLAFSGSRTYHRMTCAIEDAGFEVRDQIMWVYGSGFPKSLDVSKAIDKTGGASVAWFGPWFRKWREERGATQKEVAALFPSKTGGLTGCVANWELGLNMPTPQQFNLIRDTFGLPFESIAAAEREVVGQRTTGVGTGGGSTPIMGDGNRDITAPGSDAGRQWEGWGTALKPAHEPICVARKPLIGTVAANVLAHGTGAINIDACRIASTDNQLAEKYASVQNAGARGNSAYGADTRDRAGSAPHDGGRWPANIIHDGSAEVVALFPFTSSHDTRDVGGLRQSADVSATNFKRSSLGSLPTGRGDTGSAARFFYCAKTSKADRGAENIHPTVKPTDLMAYLVRLVTPPGGTVLDPFMGSGSTGKACMREGFRFVGIDMTPEYVAIAKVRIKHEAATVAEAARIAAIPPAQTDMFGEAA